MFVFTLNKSRIFFTSSRFKFSDRCLFHPSSHSLRRFLWRLVHHRLDLNLTARFTDSVFIGTSDNRDHSSRRQQSSWNNSDSRNKAAPNHESETSSDASVAVSQLSDPPIITWFDAIIPSKLIPYTRLARLDKPIGTMLLVRCLFTYLIKFAFAVPALTSFTLLDS